MSRDESHDHTFKLLLIGDSAVGKSSMLLRFTDGTFEEDIGATVGVDFKFKYLTVQGKRIKLTIWDTAGQERFRTLTSSYYRGAQGVVLVYDITNKQSFDNLQMWQNEVDMYSSLTDVVTLLVGNKVDLVQKDPSLRAVPRRTAEEFARKNGMMLIEASAKTKEGIQQTFEEVANKILDTPSLLQTGPGGRTLNQQGGAEGGGACGC
eukprot:NODE_4395_length_787_cov_70.795455_g4372_i0.p1 GENE.NODE_4395_length_787_cov_70.795455_g4372_i0~~NODE_4395_length_787_cov_70.795455_g4372_i0.p1  ORF type:complete len:207 (-),score=33.48 NODE_4395_length_787_cov_70.795455_g4372_i0:80-700(-)